MNEAPKKIWKSKGTLWEAYSTQYENDIPYIRADIVDELVAALKVVRCWTSVAIHHQYHVPLIEAALKKLEESHD